MSKGRRPILFILLLIVILTPVFSGCNKYEPDELAYVLLIGIDHGAENLLRISYLLAIPKEMAGGGGGGEGGGGGGTKPAASSVVTVESPSVYVSMNMVNTFIGRRLTLMHAKGIVFSEAMAKDGAMGKFIAILEQFRETRGTMFLAVSKDKPEEILEAMKPFLETNPAKYFELLAQTQRYTGLITSEKLQDFYDEIKIEGTNPISILVAKSKEKLPPHTGHNQYRPEGNYTAGQLIKKGGPPLEAMGAAVFKEDKMVGELNGKETTLYSMFRGKFKRGIFSLPDPMDRKTILSMDVSQRKAPQIKIKLTGEGPVINTKFFLEGNVLGDPSTVDYSLPHNRLVLEKAFAGYIKKGAEDLVEKTQQEFNSDILGFGYKARRLVWTEQEWQKLNWSGIYPTAAVNVEVDYKIRRTGTQLRVMPLVKPEQGLHEGDNPR